MRTFLFAVGVLLLAVGFAAPASADTISYDMGNHPDAAKWDGSSTSGSDGPYGLRWDDGTGTGGSTTFSGGDNGLVVEADDQTDDTPTGGLGSVSLSFDLSDLAAGATLSGTMFDNINGGDAWTLSFTFTGLTAVGNGWKASGGSGTLTRGLSTIDLTGKQNGSGDAAYFYDDGHRLKQTDTWVLRGWLQGGGTNDFLMIGTPVPEPGSLLLLASGLAGMGVIRRRRKRA